MWRSNIFALRFEWVNPACAQFKSNVERYRFRTRKLELNQNEPLTHPFQFQMLVNSQSRWTNTTCPTSKVAVTSDSTIDSPNQWIIDVFLQKFLWMKMTCVFRLCQVRWHTHTRGVHSNQSAYGAPRAHEVRIYWARCRRSHTCSSSSNRRNSHRAPRLSVPVCACLCPSVVRWSVCVRLDSLFHNNPILSFIELFAVWFECSAAAAGAHSPAQYETILTLICLIMMKWSNFRYDWLTLLPVMMDANSQLLLSIKLWQNWKNDTFDFVAKIDEPNVLRREFAWEAFRVRKTGATLNAKRKSNVNRMGAMRLR